MSLASSRYVHHPAARGQVAGSLFAMSLGQNEGVIVNNKKLVRFFDDQKAYYGMPTISRAYVVIGREANPGETLHGMALQRCIQFLSRHRC